ncbi:MAG: hypothetical protein AAGK21_11545 [Bacteroidota bacterium]
MSRLLLLIPLLLAGCAAEGRRQPYQPHTKPSPNAPVAVEPALVTVDHFDRVEAVLAFYGVTATREGPTAIAVDTSISQELMWNYTSKAENRRWLRQHLGDTMGAPPCLQAERAYGVRC